MLRYDPEGDWSAPGTRATWRQRSDVVLATAEPLAVMPAMIRRGLDVEVTPAPGWSGSVPDWRGLACAIGRVQMWLPVQGNFPQRPFSVLVLLPKGDSPQALPYVYLGAQFLLEYAAVVTLDCPARQGSLRIP
jgi:hypothetical protein